MLSGHSREQKLLMFILIGIRAKLSNGFSLQENVQFGNFKYQKEAEINCVSIRVGGKQLDKALFDSVFQDAVHRGNEAAAAARL